ncbi:MAG TPA: class I SAM-dependent methyltransferase [Pseudonocardiaceae bacterium]
MNGVRAAYDLVAADYGRRSAGGLAGRPVDRAVLDAFAELVAGRTADGLPLGTDGPPPDQAPRVLDAGCGPGHVTAYLRGLGLDAFGLDLSPAMVEFARAAYPGVTFAVGSMTAPDAGDGELDGLLAWYSTIHLTEDELRVAIGEFRRVLRPGGVLLLAFQTGDTPVHVSHGFGHDISLVVRRRQPGHVARLLEDVDLPVFAQVSREPDGGEGSGRAYLLARRARRPKGQ